MIAHISTTEVEIMEHWLDADFDEHGCAMAWLCPLHELGMAEDGLGYVLIAPEARGGLRRGN